MSNIISTIIDNIPEPKTKDFTNPVLTGNIKKTKPMMNIKNFVQILSCVRVVNNNDGSNFSGNVKPANKKRAGLIIKMINPKIKMRLKI